MRTIKRVTGEARPIPPRPSVDAEPRLRRLRALAWLLDRSVSVGGNRRFGLDPLIGLIPGLGDWLGGGLSLYIVYEAMRLGVSWPVLGRMLFNVALESVVGVVPVAGDVFDFYWQANYRNLQLVDQHYQPRLRPRSLRAIGFVFTLIVAVVIGLAILSGWALVLLFQWMFGG